MEEQRTDVEFFVTVIWAHWTLHRQSPAYLLRQARSGDLAAFEKVVGIDKRVLGDEVLASRYQELLGSSSAGVKRRVAQAASGRAHELERVTVQCVKTHLAALIANLADHTHRESAAGERLGPIRLRALFDAIAFDLHGHLIDPDLPPEAEAWKKALDRARRTLKPATEHVIRRLT